jgi:hypothetical protein
MAMQAFLDANIKEVGPAVIHDGVSWAIWIPVTLSLLALAARPGRCAAAGSPVAPGSHQRSRSVSGVRTYIVSDPWAHSRNVATPPVPRGLALPLRNGSMLARPDTCRGCGDRVACKAA